MLRAIFARHACSSRHATPEDPVSKQYPDLTEEGIRQAWGLGKFLVDSLLDADRGTVFDKPGTVFLVAATSDQPRTKQTALVFAEAIEREGWSGEVFIDARHYDGSQDGGLCPIEELIHRANIGPSDRVVLAYPVYVAQFGYGWNDRWTRWDPASGKQVKTEYFSELLNEFNQNHAQALHSWLKQNGRLTLDDGTELQGPCPVDVAKDYLNGLIRTHAGISSLFPGRELVVVAVGHQWDLDALATLLATGGVSYNSWGDIVGRAGVSPEEMVIGECELLTNITYDPETGKSTVTYRGRDFSATIPETFPATRL